MTVILCDLARPFAERCVVVVAPFVERYEQAGVEVER